MTRCDFSETAKAPFRKDLRGGPDFMRRAESGKGRLEPTIVFTRMTAYGQPRRCCVFRRGSLHHSICRPSHHRAMQTGGLLKLTIYALAIRLYHHQHFARTTLDTNVAILAFL